MNVLALNCGSSSLKYQLFDWTKSKKLASGLVDRIGQAGATIKHQNDEAPSTKKEVSCQNHSDAIEHVLKALFEGKKDLAIDAVGHRVVHGGSRFARSVIIDADVIATIEELIPLAPLHNPPNLAGIVAAKKLLPGIPQIAVFDTAFHQTMPPEAYTYAVPHSWVEELGVRRYGFHGTSHLYVSRKVAKMLNRPVTELRLITCHVGNGVSLAAIKHGKSIDTSMGLTPLEGAIMGTRSGDLDAGIIPYVHNQTQQPFEQIFDALNKKSGMLALSGHSDLRDVEDKYLAGDPRCTTALEAASYRLKKYIGAYAAAMGGVDAIVFTAGVGENSPIIRGMALSEMEYLGVKLDIQANEVTWRGVEGLISTKDSPVKVMVVSTDEERIIIEDSIALLEGRSPADPNFRYSFENGSLATAK
ncbi:MAG TPA: acetate kinase [Cyanobacteria bacterium UBA8530]|nr:acetate kinase [Cyanobacteria bacterium UBA8530]